MLLISDRRVIGMCKALTFLVARGECIEMEGIAPAKRLSFRHFGSIRLGSTQIENEGIKEKRANQVSACNDDATACRPKRQLFWLHSATFPISNFAPVLHKLDHVSLRAHNWYSFLNALLVERTSGRFQLSAYRSGIIYLSWEFLNLHFCQCKNRRIWFMSCFSYRELDFIVRPRPARWERRLFPSRFWPSKSADARLIRTTMK